MVFLESVNLIGLFEEANLHVINVFKIRGNLDSILIQFLEGRRVVIALIVLIKGDELRSHAMFVQLEVSLELAIFE